MAPKTVNFRTARHPVKNAVPRVRTRNSASALVGKEIPAAIYLSFTGWVASLDRGVSLWCRGPSYVKADFTDEAVRSAGVPVERERLAKFETGRDPETSNMWRTSAVALPEKNDWTEPRALAIPKEGYFQSEQGRYGPVFPKTPACYGFTIIAKVKPGREQVVREYAKTIETAVRDNPFVLGPLELHYLRWVLFDIGTGLHFMYQGIFDTDFDQYLDDAVALFNQTGITTVFTNLEGWPEDWRTNVPAVGKFFHEHQCPSFLEYGEYPYATADEIKKALKLKQAFSEMLDQMQ